MSLAIDKKFFLLQQSQPRGSGRNGPGRGRDTNSSDRTKLNRYMRARRAELRRDGICVDCQKWPVTPGKAVNRAKRHVLCDGCRQERRERWQGQL